MHTYLATGGTLFHYNSDFSGDVNIIITGGEEIIKISGRDILELVAYGYIRPKNIAAIEDKNWMELLGD